MKLSELARDIPGARRVGADVEVGAIEDDSRRVGPGTLFVAVRGRTRDGHDFLGDVMARGAAAAIVEAERPIALPQLVVPSSAAALGIALGVAAGRPAERMAMVGVTGTNGKTTTSYLVEAIVAAAGGRPGVLGTVNYRFAGQVHEASYTTPTPQLLHRVLGEMAAARTSHAVLEVSSAALAMERLAGVRFRVAAFSNLTQDHLDVHGTMEAYRAAKALLFGRELADDGVAVINVDDPSAPAMIEAARSRGRRRVLRVTSRPGAGDAEIRVAAATSSVAGIDATIATPRGTLAVRSAVLIGGYNVDNLALAVGIGEALELPHEAIARGLAAMPGVPGRVERVANDAGLDVLVDYAHTPDALVNVLAALRPLTRRRLICVFGCGGDRDPTKRPRMGAAVAAGADLAVVTSDNPRTEDPRAILAAILPAVPTPFFVDVDRRTAIRAAIAEATPGDVVLIAGKGHEDYQILGTEKIHFDDREEAAAAARLRQGFTVDEVVAACDGFADSAALGPAAVRGAPATRAARFARVVIDGRAAAPGDLYVAIRGERHDGHGFAAGAVAAGATGVLADRAGAAGLAAEPALKGAAVIEVGDTRLGLAGIARLHRRRWGGRLIGVTGSAGKTTTKELLAAALAPLGRVHRTAGSLNNETGVPLTLLGLRPHHDLAVIEMGMRGLGQIDFLARVAEPEVGVVTNAGTAHVGVVGSVERIAQGKGELFHRLAPGGTAIFPADDDRLREHAGAAPRRLSFGELAGADVRLRDYQPRGAAGTLLVVELAPLGRQVEVALPLVGRHNAKNALCVLAVAVALELDPARVAAGLAAARPAPMRGELGEAQGRHLLIDCYNANPAAMRAAIETTAELAGGPGGAGINPEGGRSSRRVHSAGAHGAIAIVGDMLELGDQAEEEHRAIGRRAAELGVAVIGFGTLAAHAVAAAIAAGGPAVAASDPAVAARLALEDSRPGAWILIKGSRGMQMERVVAALADVPPVT